MLQQMLCFVELIETSFFCVHQLWHSGTVRYFPSYLMEKLWKSGGSPLSFSKCTPSCLRKKWYVFVKLSHEVCWNVAVNVSISCLCSNWINALPFPNEAASPGNDVLTSESMSRVFYTQHNVILSNSAHLKNYSRLSCPKGMLCGFGETHEPLVCLWYNLKNKINK